MLLKVPGSITINKIERLLFSLEQEKNDYIDLEIPKEIENQSFSIIPSLVQLIYTWARNERSNSLRTKINTKQNLEIQLKDLVEQEFGFSSIVLSWKKKILDEEGVDIKYLFKPYNEEIHYKMKFIENTKGDKVFLTCFDHLPKNKGLLDCFYINNNFISSEVQLDFLITKGIREKVLRNIRFATTNALKNIYDDLISIIYELMKNTHEWARTSEENKELNPNIRGVYIKFHKSTKQAYEERYSTDIGLFNYFKSTSFVPNSRGELYFIELSVFDSGPGLVNRYTGNNENFLTKNDEIEIIKKCLTKHITSATGEKRLTKGLGLERVMRILNKKGFLRIRTGHCSLYRDLKNNPYSPDLESSNISLFDGVNNSKTAFSNMPKVEGTLMTIVYPIDFKGNE